MKYVDLIASDGEVIKEKIYEALDAKYTIVICHGMCEHMERYTKIGEFLSQNGANVVTYNIRGHGEYYKKNLGFFAKKGGFNRITMDLDEVISNAQKEYNLPIILYGHSMGTILVRYYVLNGFSNKTSKIILSGSPNSNPAAGIGAFLASFIAFFKGKNKTSNLLTNMAFGPFRKSVKGGDTTGFDWLSYNKENVEKYIDDPYCGFTFTLQAYHDMLSANKKMGKAKLYKNVVDQKILFICGEEDPCTGFEDGINSTINTLNSAGFNDIKVIKYPNMRHEILNEDDYQKVFDDVLRFVNE